MDSHCMYDSHVPFSMAMVEIYLIYWVLYEENKLKNNNGEEEEHKAEAGVENEKKKD